MPSSFTAAPSWVDRYFAVRQFTRELCDPLEVEDYVVQSMPNASPTRWHLAHTTWFFETFLLQRFVDGYVLHNDEFQVLFNSYYNSVGQQHPRGQRGLLTRPTVQQIWDYRDAVDGAVAMLLENPGLSSDLDVLGVVEMGMHHEQQHQELILTDIKHVLSCNPVFPAYHAAPIRVVAEVTTADWCPYSGGRMSFGFAAEGFHFDNEGPRFDQLLPDYRLQNRLVTNREFLEFIEDGGYRHAEHWLSLGWDAVQEEGWRAPLDWVEVDGDWHEFTLHGLQVLDPDQPVCHVSYFEADAMARWAGARLPTEFEWENAAASLVVQGNLADTRRFHPGAPEASATSPPRQVFGDVWEWTSSPYSPYPGYRPQPGALGEYNGKFMCNQFVLRGGSCVTSQTHVRPTYRNFFPPNSRWQFSGIRLAR